MYLTCLGGTFQSCCHVDQNVCYHRPQEGTQLCGAT